MVTIWLGLLALMLPGQPSGFPLQAPETLVQPQAGPSEDELMFAKIYLKKFYGYKPKPGRERRGVCASADQLSGLGAKVKEMQQFFGLPDSGELTAETLAVMRRPRCGLSDVEPFHERLRWKRHTLSYRISNYGSTARASQVHRAFRAAWKLWAEVTTIRFRRRSRRDADIIISFHSGDHEDGSPFDGKGGALAHAFLPGQGIGGDVHFDEDEDWTFNGTGFNLHAVAVHEFGHALGLDHSMDPGAVMHPTYNFVSDLQLSYQDVKDVQHMYGINPIFSSLSLKRPPPRTPNKCNPDLSFDAVTELQQEILFFKDRFMWRKHPTFEDVQISLMNSLWSVVPPYLDAAYENVERNKNIFFKGNQYWAIRQLKLLDGYPRNISELGFPSRIQSVDAALHFRIARTTIFFTGTECWSYNEERMRMEEGSPVPIEQQWPGITPPIDAAVFYKGFLYFFKGSVQYKYDPEVKYVISKRPANDMLACKDDTGNDTLMKGYKR